MNFTFDDADSVQLSYSSGWAVQPAPDDNFFAGTYHVAQENEANVTCTFTGSFIAIYGSKGPAHGQFKITYDDAVTEALPAYASDSQFQQPLWAHAWPEPGTHTVAFTALLVDDSAWLDFDYVTLALSQGSNSTATTTMAPVMTLVPPWSTTTSSQPPSTTSSSSSSHSPPATLILTILFATLLAVLLGGIVIYVLRRRLPLKSAMPALLGSPPPSASSKGASHAFGESSASLDYAGGSTSAMHSHSAVHLYSAGSPPAARTRADSTREYAHMLVPLRSPPAQPEPLPVAEPLPPLRPNRAPEEEYASEDEMVFARTDTPSSTAGQSGRSGAGSGAGAYAAYLAKTRKLGGSPFGRRHKGDADSMRTDFLQV